MLKTYKYRIYPTTDQRILLSKHFGAVRFIYNLALEVKKNAYSTYGVNVSRFDLSSQLTELKQDCTWLKEVNAQSLQGAIKNLDTAYTNFFKGSGFPKFKKRSGHQSFQCPQRVLIKNNKLILPKFQEGIKLAQHRPLHGTIKTVTISKTPTDKYYASVLVENEENVPVKNPIQYHSSVGIDLGIKTFATLSDGTVFENPKYLRKSMDRLKVLQKRASRKVKGSNNRKRANKQVAICHERISNKRQDFLHKITHAITKQYDTIVVEDLNVAGMVRNHKLAQAINDVSWSTFETFLKYKSDWLGKNVVQIDRWYASSKTCSCCGHKKEEMLLSERIFHCTECGLIIDRDLNASINIKNSGVERPVEHLESSAVVGAMKDETNRLSGSGSLGIAPLTPSW